MVLTPFNPRTQEAKAGRISEFQASQNHIKKPCLKNKKNTTLKLQSGMVVQPVILALGRLRQENEKS